MAVAATPTSIYARQSTDLAAVLRAAGVGADALVSIRNGEVLAAQLPGTPSDEVGVFAVARVSTSVDTFLARFGNLDVYRRRAATHGAGAVSSPPLAAEFSALPIPASDVAALAGCQVGSCSVKVPAAVLDSVQGRDAAAVNRIVQGMFLDLARRFIHGGAGALPAYADKVPPTTPAQGMSALLAGPTPLLSLFPDLRAELADTSRPLPTAQLFWLSESFGLREVVELNAMVAQRTDQPNLPAVVLTQRLYSSHYFLGGYAVTALVIDTVGGADSAGTYLVYSARYRLDTSLDFLERPALESHLHQYTTDLITEERAALGGR